MLETQVCPQRHIALWTQREVHILILLAKYRKLTAKKMLEQGYFSGRSRDSVLQKMRRMRLANPVLSLRCRLAKHFDDRELEEFHRFIEEHRDSLTSYEIAQHFGVSPGTVKDHQKKLGIHIGWKEAMKLPATRKKIALLKVRLSQSNTHRAEMRKKRREEKFPKLALRHFEKFPDCDRKICRSCGREWPYTKIFFIRFQKRFQRGMSRYLVRRCRLCPYDRKKNHVH